MSRSLGRNRTVPMSLDRSGSSLDCMERSRGAGTASPVRRHLSFRHEFGSHDANIARGLNAEPDLSSLQPDHGDANVVADEQFFHQLPGQHEHISMSSLGARIASLPGPPSAPRAWVCGLSKGNLVHFCWRDNA